MACSFTAHRSRWPMCSAGSGSGWATTRPVKEATGQVTPPWPTPCMKQSWWMLSPACHRPMQPRPTTRPARTLTQATWMRTTKTSRPCSLVRQMRPQARTSTKPQPNPERLKQAFQAAGDPFPVLQQGEAPRPTLLDDFRRTGNAVLVGSHSFWEGIDVKGDALTLVVIDKLPFAPPDDPVLAKRLEMLTQAGGNAFMSHQVPQAIIALKQGAGRLIRSETDRGVLMICDTRLIDKPYR